MRAALLLLPGSLFSALGADSAPAGTFSGVSSPAEPEAGPTDSPEGAPLPTPYPEVSLVPASSATPEPDGDTPSETASPSPAPDGASPNPSAAPEGTPGASPSVSPEGSAAPSPTPDADVTPSPEVSPSPVQPAAENALQGLLAGIALLKGDGQEHNMDEF